MRKQTKIAALVSAAALLTIGASMTSFAAGWTYDEGAGYWVYKDNDGYNVEYEWRKWTDGKWCYLGEGGKCVADELVEYGEGSLYYLNSEGFRVMGDWHYEENIDGETLGDSDIVPGGFWYYLGSDGKAYKGGDKQISGKWYRFDDDGRMLAGWVEVDGKWFYYNDTVDDTNSSYGEALTKWQWMPIRGDVTTDQDAGEAWYYFSSKGEMYTGDRYIDKKWWHFDSDGKMSTGWVVVGTPSVASAQIGEYAYFNSDEGKIRSGWYYTNAGKDTIKGDGNDHWFYLKPDGTRWTADGQTGTNGDEATVGMIRVKGKNYLIDKTGCMLDGVQTLTNVQYIFGGSGTFNGIYFFDNSENASGGTKGDMLVNVKKTIYDNYDNATDYYFDKNGRAYQNTIAGNCYYNADGHKVVSDYDAYRVVDVNKDTKVDGKTYTFTDDDVIIVRENGTVSRSTVVAGIDGYIKAYVGRIPSKTDRNKVAEGKLHCEWVPGYSADSKDINPYAVTCYTWE